MLIEVDGFEREVYLVNDQQPGPLIDVDEGDDIEVFVQNDLDVPITMHWHGKWHKHLKNSHITNTHCRFTAARNSPNGWRPRRNTGR